MSRVNTTATQREKHEHQMSVNARALRDIQGSIRRPYLTMEAFFTCPVDMGVPKVKVPLPNELIKYFNF